MDSTSQTVPVNILTGFLGSGKTTLLQHLLRADGMQRTVVLINEYGEIGLDHLLVERVDESVVLLQSGCICCSIRGDLSGALRGLLSRRERGEIPEFDRVVIETTGLADPAPILYTLSGEPVVRHHYRLCNVITTIDAVNAAEHLSRNPEGLKQVAVADRLVITKADLATSDDVTAVRATLQRLNPGAEVIDVTDARREVERLLAPRQLTSRDGYAPAGLPESFTFRELSRHSAQIASVSLALDQPLDWTAFGIWLSMLLNRHGADVLRVKGILNVQGSAAPVFINAVQHIVHPPQHLQRWPTEDRRSRIVFIVRDIDTRLLRRSLSAFCSTSVADLATI
jgi:G3E family GTPase